jgi:hypothetical protein
LGPTSIPELVTSGLHPHWLVLVTCGMELPTLSGNYSSAPNCEGPYKTLQNLDDTHMCCSVQSYNAWLLAPLHCDPYKSTAWHVLSSAVPVTLRFPETWSQWRPLCNTNM